MSIAIMDETLSYLRFNCIWPAKGTDLNPGLSYYVKFILMILSTTVILIGSTMHLVVSLQRNSRHNISEDLVMIIAEIGAYYFLSIFVRYQKQIAEIYVDLSCFEKFGKPPHFDARNKRLILYSRIYKGYIDCAIIIFCTLPYFLKGMCEKHSSEIDEVCGLLVATWLPFDINNRFPLFQIFYFLQSYTIVMTLKGAALISFAIMETMEHLIVRLHHVKILLEETIQAESREKRAQLFIKAIEYHIDIFRIGNKTDKCYSGCLFLHLLLSGALFGCIGYRFMEGFSINALCLFSGWLLSLYIVCISGQRLIDEALSVADLVYNCPWYETDANFQKNVSLIIKRSQRPLVIHTGPFGNVSHVIVLTIFKTAYSYMTLLNTTST